MSIRQFKVFSTLFVTTGILWLVWNWVFYKSVSPCLFKNLTDIPCPGCGSTRAAFLALSFRFSEALALNPLGILYAVAIFVLPFWWFYDLFYRSNSMFNYWNKFENLCKRKSVLFILFVMIGSIWIHNIMIGL